ncbi:MAG: hypothetical protein IJ068_02400 [Bacilli bacterium]|nr:hypothetical protein [Bacilli bacterium]
MDEFNNIFELLNIVNNKLESIYNNLKRGIVNDEELKPIKKELLLIARNIEFGDLYLFLDCIKVLLLLHQENKLDIVNKEFMDFLKPSNEAIYLVSILYALTFNDERLSNNILENIQSLNYLKNSFYGTYKILIKNYNSFNYINKTNNIYINLASKYLHIKDNIMSKNYQIYDTYILFNVLETIMTFVYINIKEYNYDYDLVNRSMNIIENNKLEYFKYFKNEKLWCIGNPLMPESLGGFPREFIVIGNLVNKIYQEETKVKKM